MGTDAEEEELDPLLELPESLPLPDELLLDEFESESVPDEDSDVLEDCKNKIFVKFENF